MSTKRIFLVVMACVMSLRVSAFGEDDAAYEAFYARVLDEEGYIGFLRRRRSVFWK
jgi:hypothetical protein